MVIDIIPLNGYRYFTVLWQRFLLLHLSNLELGCCFLLRECYNRSNNDDVPDCKESGLETNLKKILEKMFDFLRPRVVRADANNTLLHKNIQESHIPYFTKSEGKKEKKKVTFDVNIFFNFKRLISMSKQSLNQIRLF